MVPHGTTMLEGLDICGRARDALVFSSGRLVVIGEAMIEADVGEGRTLRTLRTTPAHAATDRLRGRPVAGGFRAAVAAAVPEHQAASSPLYLLLDDLPVAALVSGYADLYGRPRHKSVTGHNPGPRNLGAKADICAGWASDATMVKALRSDGKMPLPVGPPAPFDEGCVSEWHQLELLAPGAMRRQRRIDVAAGDGLHVSAMFRDTHADADGAVTVLHEWSIELDADPATLRIERCRATPHALPWPECPSAADSAGRLVGRHLGELRVFVIDELRGTSTCTHLNDLMRSVADAAALAKQASKSPSSIPTA